MEKLTATEKALLGSLEMLTTIANGGSFTALEFHARLERYREALANARPDTAGDPYFRKSAFGLKG